MLYNIFITVMTIAAVALMAASVYWLVQEKPHYSRLITLSTAVNGILFIMAAFNASWIWVATWGLCLIFNAVSWYEENKLEKAQKKASHALAR